MNENATLFMPHKDDTQATTVFNSPSLVVTGASAKHLLAMKIDAGRPEDIEDIEWLLEQSDIADIDEAIEVHRETYPHAPLLTTSRSRLETALRRTAERKTAVDQPTGKADVEIGDQAADPAAGPNLAGNQRVANRNRNDQGYEH